MRKPIPVCLFLLLSFCLNIAFAAEPKVQPVALSWLHAYSLPQTTGVSWGVPWPRGAVKKNQSFTLTDANGEALPLQTWPMAYWPDGSLKWSGFATVAGTERGGFKLDFSKAQPKAKATGLQVQESTKEIRINTGQKIDDFRVYKLESGISE